MSVLGTKCATGMPMFIRNDPEAFRPRGAQSTRTLNGTTTVTAVCHFCDQMTMVKSSEPRKGFFVEHSESQKGHTPQRFKGSGTPARVRNRRR